MVCGPRPAVEEVIRRHADRGDLVAMSSPRPWSGGVAVRLRVRKPVRRQVAAGGPLPARQVPRQRARSASTGTSIDRRQLVGTVAVVGGAVAGVTAVVVVVVNGLAGLARWAVSTPAVLVGVLLAAIVAAGLAVRGGGTSGGGCGGVHCAGCGGHRRERA